MGDEANGLPPLSWELEVQPTAVWRDVEPRDLQAIMRIVLGVHGELSEPKHPDTSGPARITLDVGGWLAWMDVGFELFSMPSCTSNDNVGDGQEVGQGEPMIGLEPKEGKFPELRSVTTAALRVALVLAMARNDGNVTHAARALRTSRRTLRYHLHAAGLYPWDRVIAGYRPERGSRSLEREPNEGDGSGDDAA